MPVGKVVRETLDDPMPSGPVVVELFTAKSCVFCPQADKAFADLADQPGVIGLACHVDYLKDGDTLARDFCVDRQNWYMDRLHAGPNYTPQIVVNGAKDALGYKTDAVAALVHGQRAAPIAPIEVTPLKIGKASTQFAVKLPPGATDEAKNTAKNDAKDDARKEPAPLLAGWQLAVTTFRKPETAGGETYRRVADTMQILPLDQYKGPAFKMTVPLSDAEGGMVVVLQREDTGRIAAAGQYLKDAAAQPSQ
jgi:hypothetical protein